MEIIALIILAPLLARLGFSLLIAVIKALVRGLFRSASTKRRNLAFHTSQVKVLDGDTVFSKPGDHRIRLFGIDAPEAKQAQGYQSTRFLKSLTDGHEVEIYPVEYDRYGRIVARLIRKSDRLDINAAMVSNGYALAETRYSKDYVRHQRRARKQRMGLWRNGKVASPRKWRAANI